MWIWNPHHKKMCVDGINEKVERKALVLFWFRRIWKWIVYVWVCLVFLCVCFVCGAIKTVNSLEQRSANYGPQASSGPPLDFVLCFQMGGNQKRNNNFVTHEKYMKFKFHWAVSFGPQMKTWKEAKKGFSKMPVLYTWENFLSILLFSFFCC